MIIGITGTLGAGKGAVVSYLVQEKNFKHYSARKYFGERMKEEGIPIDRDTMADFANQLRKEHGPRYLFDELYTQAVAQGGNAVIESIRTVGEAEALKERGGILLSVDAPQEVRFSRIQGRGSTLDRVSFEEFKEQEAREMNSTDPNKQNISGVMRMADAAIINEGSLTELHQKMNACLETLHNENSV